MAPAEDEGIRYKWICSRWLSEMTRVRSTVHHVGDWLAIQIQNNTGLREHFSGNPCLSGRCLVDEAVICARIY